MLDSVRRKGLKVRLGRLGSVELPALPDRHTNTLAAAFILWLTFPWKRANLEAVLQETLYNRPYTCGCGRTASQILFAAFDVRFQLRHTERSEYWCCLL